MVGVFLKKKYPPTAELPLGISCWAGRSASGLVEVRGVADRQSAVDGSDHQIPESVSDDEFIGPGPPASQVDGTSTTEFQQDQFLRSFEVHGLAQIEQLVLNQPDGSISEADLSLTLGPIDPSRGRDTNDGADTPESSGHVAPNQ